MSDYTSIIDWVKATLDAALTLDHSTKGAHLSDDVVNADTLGHVHYEEPADYREVQLAFTGGELVNYFVDVHYRVAGSEADTAAKARS